MKTRYLLILKYPIISLLFVTVLIADITTAQDKMTAEEILSKHLNSIGGAESRGDTKSIMVVGTSKANFHGRGAGVADGIVVLASQGERNLIGMKFNNADYPFEMMGYDGDKLAVRQIRPGIRTVLGDFLRLHEYIFKNGVMGGTLSRSWVLLDFNEKKGKLKFAGIQKVDEKQLYKLNYSPKKGGDLDISFFFEPDTFRLVRTEYKRVLSSQLGSGGVDSSAGQSETRYTMVEDFSDFKIENKLNLPHYYRLSLEIISGNGTVSYQWQMELQKFVFNQPIELNQFQVDTYTS
jgi:hypothetical protein